MKKDLTVDKITDGTFYYNDIDPIKISVNDLDSNKITAIYDQWNSLSTSGQPYSWSTLNNNPYIYTTSSRDEVTMDDIQRLEAKVDDNIADMNGRLDVLLTDCVFSNDLSGVHSLISDLQNENIKLHRDLSTLEKDFNDAMVEMADLKLQINNMLSLISYLQNSKNNI